MARTGITYEDVTAAIDKMVAAGEAPTIMGIREVLGTGSPNTIHRHLDEWRNAQPKQQAKPVQLPAVIADALTKELERQAAEARAEISADLQRARDTAIYLANEGEDLEANIRNLQEELEAKDAENAKLKADFDRVTDALSRAMHDLETERKVTNEQRDELALTKNRVMTLTDQVTDLKAELATVKQEAKASADAAIAAEKMAAVATAQLEAEKAKTADLVSRLADEKTAIAKLGDRYELALTECAKAKEDLTYAERHIAELNQEISEHIAAYKNSERIADALKVEVKHHLGELDIAQAEIDELKKALTAAQTKVTKK